MNFPSIEIQGSILSSDLLTKIRSEQAIFQQGKDFNPDLTNAKLKDEISLAWQEAKGQWAIYKSKLARLKDGETGTTETRNFWISPLLTNLSYNLTYDRKGEELNGKTFPIGYRDSSLDNFPVYIGGYHESLDKRPENKQLRVSPHAMVQEYLNYSEHLYGMVTNGRQLRLLRDASRITRLSYVEFNLEKMMEEDLYPDFVILHRLLHASRMPKRVDSGAESIIEKYHQEGLEAGSTIRSKLGDAVKDAIKNLANGFINHPNNVALREAVTNGNIDADEYYRHQLRIIYRLLFLFVIEERNLVYGDSKIPETKRFNHIYFNYYSLLRLRKLARKLLPPEAIRHHDLWQSLVSTFSLFEKKEIGEKLGIMSLQGDLFGYNAIGNNQYDLHQCYLSNEVLLNIIKSLSYFENDNGVLIAVNYGGLDVEEFGSVYEGLLELRLEFNKVEGSDNYSGNWKKQLGGREFQSHYTPEDLVQPLIKHSLDYLVEDIFLLYAQKKVSKENTIKALLKLKVCDVACGSGHILLSAARRIALAVARVQTDEEQPNPLSIRKAMKDVVRNCIYGVDKNPLAVELCKIALWLEAYNPREPLNFLDHHIKCGDAIVGLAHRNELEKGIPDGAFKTLPGDDKDIAAAFRKRNQQERKQKEQSSLFETVLTEEVKAVIEKYNLFKNLPETNSEEVEKKAKEHIKYEQDYHRIRLKQLADAQVAQFFVPKTDANKDVLITDAEYRNFLRQVNKHLGVLQSNKLVKAQVVADKNHKNFFHWFIEFPEVFDDGGFDCVLGNPPFLGGQKISGTYGEPFLEFIKYEFAPIGAVDLVTYFFRRIFTIVKDGGFQSLISTNTIGQGNAREDGLGIIVKQGGVINHAVKSMKWPGQAAVVVALVTITKQNWKGKFILESKEVGTITPYLDDAETISNPQPLKENGSKSFQGSIVLGKGFVLEPNEALEFIAKNPKNKEVVFPYLNGDDLNNSADQSPSRWVINFFNWPEEKAKRYIDCYKHIEKYVKPERDKLLVGNTTAVERGKRWWQFGRPTMLLYNSIKELKRVYVITRVSKYVVIAEVDARQIFMDKIVVLAFEQRRYLSLLQSSLYDHWSWKYSSTLGGGTINYSPSECFETFPFPQHLTLQQKQQLEAIGEAYHEHRKQLMLGMQLGLTKTYNLFHCNAVTAQSINDKDKQVAALQKHLEKTANTISFNEAIQGIIKLRELHVQMDDAVLGAYGWNDIELKHDFYEVDYLPENDRLRYTINPETRKEVLKRLLALNHKIYAEEQALIEAKQITTNKPRKITKTKQLPNQTLFSMRPETAYAAIYSVQDIARITKLSISTIKRWFDELYSEGYEGISKDNSTSDQPLLINFYGVHELIVLYDLRVVNKIPLKDILDARKWLIERFRTGPNFYPFTSQKVLDTISKAGKQIIFTDEKEGDFLTLGKGNAQLNLEFIKEILKRIVFDKEMVSRLYLSDSHLIAIDPNLAGGRPCTVENEILIDSIKSVYLESKDTKYIASVYEISESAVQDALNFEQATVLN
jgi:hypothetical protein